MAWRAHVLQLLLLTASIASTTCGPAFKTAARIQAKIQKQQSLKLRKLQQSSQPLLGLDTKDKKVRVLAFGDSITEGWINSAYIKVPWSPKVQQMLQQKLGSDWNVEVINGGVGGAGVLDRLNDAFHQDLSEAESSGRPYHYIIFEGGINDLLLKHRNAPEIFGRMKELWAQANAAGATVVVIPTLPTKVKGEREDQRKALTNMIRQYIKDKQASGFEGLYLLDLESTFDYYNLSPERRAQIFDDGIHMTKYGYELLGDKAYDGLVDAMGLQAPERARSSATTRKPVEHKSDKKVNDAQRQRQSMQKP